MGVWTKWMFIIVRLMFGAYKVKSCRNFWFDEVVVSCVLYQVAYQTCIFCEHTLLSADIYRALHIWNLIFKGKLLRFLALSLCSGIQYIIWNSTLFFFNVLCVSVVQLQNLLFCLSLWLPSAFPIALKARWHHVHFERNFTLWLTKTPRHLKLHNTK